MTHENARLVDNGEMPNEWCQSTNSKYYVFREWTNESDTLGGLVSLLEDRLREEFYLLDGAVTLKHDDKIRIVFWFDN